MNDGAVRSPGVGKVIEILVTVGVQVAAGDEVIVIESMKMEFRSLHLGQGAWP